MYVRHVATATAIGIGFLCIDQADLLYGCYYPFLPACGAVEPVVWFGKNRSGTERLWCKACRKAWTLTPINRRVTLEKEA